MHVVSGSLSTDLVGPPKTQGWKSIYFQGLCSWVLGWPDRFIPWNQFKCTVWALVCNARAEGSLPHILLHIGAALVTCTLNYVLILSHYSHLLFTWVRCNTPVSQRGQSLKSHHCRLWLTHIGCRNGTSVDEALTDGKTKTVNSQ